MARDGGNALCFGAAIGFERDLYLEFGYPPDYLTAEDIMLPFYAFLAKGARYIPEPLMQYRVHPHNDSLSLTWERSGPIDKLLVEVEMYSVHLAHSLEMRDELERRRAADPARFGDLAAGEPQHFGRFVNTDDAVRPGGRATFGQALRQSRRDRPGAACQVENGARPVADQAAIKGGHSGPIAGDEVVIFRPAVKIGLRLGCGGRLCGAIGRHPLPKPPSFVRAEPPVNTVTSIPISS